MRTRVRRSVAGAAGTPPKATSSGAEHGDLQRLGRRRREACEEVGGRRAPPDGAGGEVAKLGPRRLGNLVDQPLGEPEPLRLAAAVEEGGQLDRPGQREGGEHLAGIQRSSPSRVPGAQVDQAPAGARACSWVGPIAASSQRARTDGSST